MAAAAPDPFRSADPLLLPLAIVPWQKQGTKKYVHCSKIFCANFLLLPMWASSATAQHSKQDSHTISPVSRESWRHRGWWWKHWGNNSEKTLEPPSDEMSGRGDFKRHIRKLFKLRLQPFTSMKLTLIIWFRLDRYKNCIFRGKENKEPFIQMELGKMKI